MPSYTSQRHLLPILLASLTAFVDALPQNKPVAVAQEESVVSKGMEIAQKYTLWVSIVVGKWISRGVPAIIEAYVSGLIILVGWWYWRKRRNDNRARAKVAAKNAESSDQEMDAKMEAKAEQLQVQGGLRTLLSSLGLRQGPGAR